MITPGTYGALQARNNVPTNPEPILSGQGRTNPERIPNHSRMVAEPILLIRSATVRLCFLLIGLATVQLWFTFVHTHPFTFWFSRTDPESKMPAGRSCLRYVTPIQNEVQRFSKIFVNTLFLLYRYILLCVRGAGSP